MSVEILMSCMYQKDFSIVKKSNIRSDAIIINQTNVDKVEIKEYDFGTVKMISTTERGLSKSRNMALKNSTADFCVICDDDEVLTDNYVEMVEEAYMETNADAIVFNIKSMNINIRPQEKLFEKVTKVNKFKSYSSVHVTFRRKIVNDNALSLIVILEVDLDFIQWPKIHFSSMNYTNALIEYLHTQELLQNFILKIQHGLKDLTKNIFMILELFFMHGNQGLSIC